SNTTWSMERSDRQRLIASPAWPAPLTTVVVVRVMADPLDECAQRPSTVTLVGLVMMSYTAERFCDWATSALISSGVASASMSYVTLMPLNPLRMSLSIPRMPETSMSPSSVADTDRSWISRFWATAATPAVRQLARP